MNWICFTMEPKSFLKLQLKALLSYLDLDRNGPSTHKHNIYIMGTVILKICNVFRVTPSFHEPKTTSTPSWGICVQAFLNFRGFYFRGFQFTAVYNPILTSSPLVLLSNLDLRGFCFRGFFLCPHINSVNWGMPVV